MCVCVCVCVNRCVSVAYQGTFGHSRLISLSHRGLILAQRAELVCASVTPPTHPSPQKKRRQGINIPTVSLILTSEEKKAPPSVARAIVQRHVLPLMWKMGAAQISCIIIVIIIMIIIYPACLHEKIRVTNIDKVNALVNGWPAHAADQSCRVSTKGIVASLKFAQLTNYHVPNVIMSN